MSLSCQISLKMEDNADDELSIVNIKINIEFLII
jgi:hypothetical protein